MSVCPDILTALATSVSALRTPQPPIPAQVIAALADVAKPGVALKIDVAASHAIGAPLITVIQTPGTQTLFDCLTARQKHVASLVVAGQSNKEIATSLGISVATVKDHVHAILHRLDLPSRGAVIAAAHAVGQA